MSSTTRCAFRVLVSALLVTGGCGDNESPEIDAPAAAPNLPSYVVPGEEAMASITLNRATGEFFVDSAVSGKIYRGLAGSETETTLELLADFTASGLTGGGHMTLTPDGKRLLRLAASGQATRLSVIDLAARSLVRDITIPARGTGPSVVQDVAVSPDGATAYATDSVTNVIHVIDLSTFATSSFPLSAEFPHIADPAVGFINATGLAIANDGTYLLVVHLIDKHLYRISLDPASLGAAVKVDTAPYNVSGNGLWLDADQQLLEVAGDELRVFRFSLDGSSTAGRLETKYQDDRFEQGLNYAVRFRDRLLVLNGNGASPTAGGGGMTLPPELFEACAGKAAGAPCMATVNGLALSGTCMDSAGVLACIPSGGTMGTDAGTTAPPKYPVRVLQLSL